MLNQRKQPGALISDGRRLYEVIEVTTARDLVLEDCGTFKRREIPAARTSFWPWRLTRRAPAVPDCVPAQ